MKNSVELALDHLGRKVGGLDTEVIYGDDQFKPDVGKQVADEMLKKHQVDFVAGIIWSNVMLAVAPTVTDAGKFMIGTNAGPHQLAGEGVQRAASSPPPGRTTRRPRRWASTCSDAGHQRRLPDGAQLRGRQGHARRLQALLQGQASSDEVYTKLGQPDYQAELAQLRAKNPKAVFVFYPGGMGIQFVQAVRRRPACAARSRSTRCSRSTRLSLPAVKDAALGQYETRYLEPGPEERRRTRSSSPTTARSTASTPSFYGAQSYDGIMLIDSAVRAVKGNLADKKGMIAAMRKANFKSVRGKFTYNINHFPIQNFYLLKVVDGRRRRRRTR